MAGEGAATAWGAELHRPRRPRHLSPLGPPPPAPPRPGPRARAAPWGALASPVGDAAPPWGPLRLRPQLPVPLARRALGPRSVTPPVLSPVGTLPGPQRPLRDACALPTWCGLGPRMTPRSVASTWFRLSDLNGPKHRRVKLNGARRGRTVNAVTDSGWIPARGGRGRACHVGPVARCAWRLHAAPRHGGRHRTVPPRVPLPRRHLKNFGCCELPA